MSALLEAKPVDLASRYAPYHQTGQDCRLTCLRNMLDYYGHKHSYATIQGLSSTFFFAYQPSDTARARLLLPDLDFRDLVLLLTGQCSGAVDNLAYLFNGVVAHGRGQASDDALDAVLPYLAEDIPVMIAVSRDRLFDHLGFPYDSSWMPEGATLTRHWILLTDVDRARGTARVFETSRREGLEIPLSVLAEARCWGDDRDDHYFKVDNRWLAFVPAQGALPFEQQVRVAVAKVVTQMTSSPVFAEGVFGLAGVDAFCRDVPRWSAMTETHGDVTTTRIHNTVMLTWAMSEFMMSGGLGRRTFGMFLRQASRPLASDTLRSAAMEYGDAGRAWRRLWTVLMNKVRGGEGLHGFGDAEVRRLLDDVRRAEHDGLRHLKRFVEGR